MDEIQRGGADLQDEHRSESPPLDDIDATILRIVHNLSFESAKSIAQKPEIARNTVLHYLHEIHGFRCNALVQSEFFHPY
jgi:hypothetical protein